MMQKQASYNIRLEKKLYDDFMQFCTRRGISISNAVRLFMSQTIANGKIPYDIDLAQEDLISQNKEDNVRKTIRVDSQMKKDFGLIADEYELTTSYLIRNFMARCLKNDKLPFTISAE